MSCSLCRLMHTGNWQNHMHAGMVICRDSLGKRGHTCSPYGLILRVIPRGERNRTRPDNRPEVHGPVLKQMEAAFECGSDHRSTSSLAKHDQELFEGVFKWISVPEESKSKRSNNVVLVVARLCSVNSQDWTAMMKSNRRQPWERGPRPKIRDIRHDGRRKPRCQNSIS
jgi:hypothetical protein